MTEILYPSNQDENQTYRMKLLMGASNNIQAMSVLHDRCREDVLFWINSFVYTYNPRKIPSMIPFITYKYQDDFILDLVDHIEKQKDILVDKSRDMGVSWCVLAVYTWFWLFKPQGYDFLCGSRKEQYVDKIGDMDTLIQKIRFMLENIPKWLLPKGFEVKNNATYMKLVNTASGNTITGEATNPNFSRGGRRRSIFFDEFAFWESDAAAWRSSADTTNCRIAVSTPYGYNNHFAKLRFSKSVDVTTLHWKLHPEKNDAWYSNECVRRNYDTVEIAQELDISYEGSEEGVLFDWDSMNKAKKFNRELSIDRIVMAIDPATTGDDAAVIYIANNGGIVLKRKIEDNSKDPIQAGKVLAAEAVLLIKKHNVQVVIGDAIGNDILTLISTLLGNSSVKIVVFKSSEKASDVAKYYNRRAELYDNAASAMRSGNLQVDDDYALMKQLSATKFKKKNGRIIIIPKEEIKIVAGESPNEADAWALIPEAMKLTHSRREVEYQNVYRKRKNHEYVVSGSEYGDWQDTSSQYGSEDF